MRKLKEKYNKWLFRKYGNAVGTFFEEIPIIYRICPLFSPAIYRTECGRLFCKGFEDGIRAAGERCKQLSVHVNELAEDMREQMSAETGEEDLPNTGDLSAAIWRVLLEGEWF